MSSSDSQQQRICSNSCHCAYLRPEPPTIVLCWSNPLSTKIGIRVLCPTGGIVPTPNPVSSSTNVGPARVTLAQRYGTWGEKTGGVGTWSGLNLEILEDVPPCLNIMFIYRLQILQGHLMLCTNAGYSKQYEDTAMYVTCRATCNVCLTCRLGTPKCSANLLASATKSSLKTAANGRPFACIGEELSASEKRTVNSRVHTQNILPSINKGEEQRSSFVDKSAHNKKNTNTLGDAG